MMRKLRQRSQRDHSLHQDTPIGSTGAVRRLDGAYEPHGHPVMIGWLENEKEEERIR